MLLHPKIERLISVIFGRNSKNACPCKALFHAEQGKRFIFGVILILVIILGAGPIDYFRNSIKAIGGKTEIINLYPNTAISQTGDNFQKGWWNASNSLGSPSLRETESFLKFSDKNSAFYSKGNYGLEISNFLPDINEFAIDDFIEISDKPAQENNTDKTGKKAGSDQSEAGSEAEAADNSIKNEYFQPDFKTASPSPAVGHIFDTSGAKIDIIDNPEFSENSQAFIVNKDADEEQAESINNDGEEMPASDAGAEQISHDLIQRAADESSADKIQASDASAAEIHDRANGDNNISEIESKESEPEFTSETESAPEAGKSDVPLSFFNKLIHGLGRKIAQAQETATSTILKLGFLGEFKTATIKFSLAISSRQKDVEILPADANSAANEKALNAENSREEESALQGESRPEMPEEAHESEEAAPEEANNKSAKQEGADLEKEETEEGEVEIIDNINSGRNIEVNMEEAESASQNSGIGSEESENTNIEAPQETGRAGIIKNEASGEDDSGSIKGKDNDAISRESQSGNNNASWIDKFINHARAQSGLEEAKLIIWYTTDSRPETAHASGSAAQAGGASDQRLWHKLDTISASHLSNAENNGYLSYEAPFLSGWEDVENLGIKIEGLVGDDEICTVYLDSVWVEAEYEPSAAVREMQKQDALKNALQLLSDNLVFKASQPNEMRFRFKKDRHDLLDIFGSWLGISKYWEDVEIKTKIVDASGISADVPLTIIMEDDGEFTVKLPKMPKGFKPGAYKIIFEIIDKSDNEERIFEFEQDFSWGVLALNVNKSVFEPLEKAYVQMAVLDDTGHTVCDAELELSVTSPNGIVKNFSTDNGTIVSNPECGPDNVIDTPDYYAHYLVYGSGIYRLRLTASTSNGVKELSDQFEVRDSLSYDIERAGPTRIYPLANYEMQVLISAKEEYRGHINETVPSSFQIFSQTVFLKQASSSLYEKYNINLPGENRYDFSIQNNGDSRELSWNNIHLFPGDRLKISYEFDAPDYSPAFYTLGPLRIYENTEPATEAFEELREWQIAADETPSDLSADNQYQSDGLTTISNGDWTGTANNTVVLEASASLYSSNTLSFYFEVKENGSSFTGATTTPSNPCNSGTAYGTCTSTIWTVATTTEGWYSPNWPYRKRVKIESDYVDIDEENFPVFASTTDADLATSSRGDGYDILFTADDGVTKLAYEREYYSSSTGQLIAWIQTEVSSSSDTYLYMYYGYAGSTDQATTTGVWDSNHQLVYHMTEDPGPGSSGDILDSTANANNGTAQTSMTSGDLVNCKLHKCYSFDGSDDYVQSASGPLNPANTDFSATAWVYADNFNNLDPSFMGSEVATVLDQSSSQTNQAWMGVIENTWPSADTTYTTRIGGAATQSGNPDTGTWRHWAIRYDGSTIYLYVNGSLVSSRAVTPFSTSGWIRIGADHSPTDTTEEWAGRIDEVHIHDTDRGLDWISTEYENQDDPDDFMDYYTEEAYTDFKEKVTVASIPDSASGYKWQVLACDENGDCYDSWQEFNAATPNFKVDANAPSAPGALTEYSRDSNSATLGFGATTTEINFEEYRIYYKEYDGTNADEGDSLFSSTSDANLDNINFNGAATTSIGGLTPGKTYSFNLYAYDSNGHKTASGRLDVEMNTLPTGAFESAGQKSDGSGRVDISIDVGDGNSDNSRVKLEYEAGIDCDFSSPLDPELDPTQTNIQADFGTPKIDNSQAYQVGTTSGWIVTSAGINNIQFDWLSKNDLPAGDGAYCLRLTANDRKEDQAVSATTTLTIDNADPTAAGSLAEGEKTQNSITLLFATNTPATDTNEPSGNAYRIYYKQGTSGVKTSNTEHDSAALDAYDFGGATSTVVSGLSPNTWYVFNIWAYDDFGNRATSTEIAIKTAATVSNQSLSFVNPASGNIAIANGENEYTFRAVVEETNGWQALDSTILRLADNNDNSSPYSDLVFEWDQSSDVFSDTGADANNAVELSPTSSSTCAVNTCTLDFIVKFNYLFASSGVDYSAQLQTENDSAIIDDDDYGDFYQTKVQHISQIHYRWRNNDGGE